MKKNFSLTSSVHKPARHIELVKHEINKYLARERRKKLPENFGFWEFDCKCGPDAESAVVVPVSMIGKHIETIAATNAPNVYVEILARPEVRKSKG